MNVCRITYGCYCELLIYFCDVFQRNIGRQGGCDVADRHGDLAVSLVADVAAFDSGEYALRDAYRISLFQIHVLRRDDFDVLVLRGDDGHEVLHLPLRNNRRRFAFAVHDVADRKGGGRFYLPQPVGRCADEQQVVDQRLPDLASFAAVGPFSEVHGYVALDPDTVQIALCGHFPAVRDTYCVPLLFGLRLFTHGHTLGTPPQTKCGCQSF